MEISKNLKLAQSDMTNSPMFSGIVTGSITGNAATVTTNANLTGMVTSAGNQTTVVTNADLTGMVTSAGNQTTVVTNANLTGMVTSAGNQTTVVTNANLAGVVTSGGNVTSFAANPTFTGLVTINSPLAYDGQSLLIINNSMYDDTGAFCIRCQSSGNELEGITFVGTGYGQRGIQSSLSGNNGFGVASFTAGSDCYGVYTISTGEDCTGIFAHATGGQGTGGQFFGAEDGIIAIGGDNGVIASGNYVGIQADGHFFGAIITGFSTGASVVGDVSVNGQTSITGNPGVFILGTALSNAEDALEVFGAGSNGASLSGKSGAYGIDQDTGLPIEFYHCRFGNVAGSRLTIDGKDANLFWESASGGNRCQITKPTTIGPGIRPLSLPNYPGLVNATRIKRTPTGTTYVSADQTYINLPELLFAGPIDHLLANSLYRLEMSFLASHGTRGYDFQIILGGGVMETNTGSCGTHSSSTGTIVPATITGNQTIKIELVGVTVATVFGRTHTSFFIKTGALTSLSFLFRKKLQGDTNVTLKNCYVGATLLHSD